MTASAFRFDATGLPKILARLISPSSMARFMCRAKAATRQRNISLAISPARSSSISTRLPITAPICRICCRRRRNSRTPPVRSASATTTRIVVYDSTDFQGGARVWWTLRLFGAKNVKLLAGGLARWKAEGGRSKAGGAPLAAKFHRGIRGAGVASLGERAQSGA